MLRLRGDDKAGSATSGTWTKRSSRFAANVINLWSAMDQDGDVLDILITRYRDRRAAGSWRLLTRNSHRLTGQAHDRPAITSLRLLAVLTALFKYAL